MNEPTKELTVTKETMLKEREKSVVMKANGLVIKNNDDLTSAGNLLSEIIKPLIKEIKGIFDPICKEAKSKHTVEVNKKKEHLAPAEHAEKIVKEKQRVYLEIQKKAEAEQERKLQELAEKEAREILENKADELEESGEAEQAEQLRFEAENVIVEPVKLESKAKLGKGQHTQKIWYATVVNENNVPRMFMVPDMEKLNKFASDHKEKADVSGVAFDFRVDIHTRSKG